MRRTVLCLLALAAASAAESPYPAITGVVDLHGKAIDGKAMLAALGARNVHLGLLPPGTTSLGGVVTLERVLGAGSAHTVLRVAPGLPRKAPKETPKVAVQVAPGGRLEGLTIEIVGAEPTSIGVILGDGARLIDVVVRCAEGGDAGIVLSEGRTDTSAAPDEARAFLADVRVEGFATGIRVRGQAALLTAERLALGGQRECGLRLDGGCAALRRLTARGSVPAITLADGAVAAVDGAELTGEDAASSLPAIVPGGGFLRLRGIAARGYAAAVADGPKGPEVAAWASHPALGGGQPLALAVEDAPAPVRPAAADWVDGCAGTPADFTAMSWGKPTKVKDWAPSLQQAVDAGRTAVYLPPDAAHAILSTLTLQGPLRVLDGLGGGLHQIYHGSAERHVGTIVVGDGDGPLEIRDLAMHLANITIRHVGRRPLVLRRTGGFRYVAEPGAGDLHLVDATPVSLQLAKGQRCWARGLAMTNHRDALIRAPGAQVWVLGLCAARWTTLAEVRDGGQVELWGGLAVARSWRPKDPLFAVADGRLTATLGELPGSPLPYDVLLADGAGGTLVARDAAPKRAADTEDRAGGSAVALLAR